MPIPGRICAVSEGWLRADTRPANRCRSDTLRRRRGLTTSSIARLGGLLAGVVFCLLGTSDRAVAGTYVQFRTVWGDIDVELYDQDKPVTVQNFLRYVQSGRYQDVIFHRCPTNYYTGLTDFVVQGGGLFVTNRYGASPNLEYVPTFGNIPNEFGVGRRFSNVYGTLAMAKLGGDTNSASAQWFFNLNNNTFLDAPDTNGFFVVFGHMVRGTNVLNMYLGRSLDHGIKNLGGMLSELPVNYDGSRTPTFADLEYVDISLLNVQVRLTTNHVQEISWNSVSGKTNRVEYTTSLPPVWTLLVATNGTGTLLKVTDTSASASKRFYRVKVDF